MQRRTNPARVARAALVFSLIGSSIAGLVTVTPELRVSDRIKEQWYNGVACVLGKDSALYVLAQGAMTATRYIDDLSTAMDERPVMDGLALYPVPANDQLIIRQAAPGALAYTILDAAGRAMGSGMLFPGETRIAVSDLANGLYMLRASDGRAVRFVVKH